MKRKSFRIMQSFCLALLVMFCTIIFCTGKVKADDSGRAVFDKLLENLYENGIIPTMNGTIISFGDYVDEMAEMGYYRLTPIGESQRFVLSVHINWESASRTPNTINSGCGLFYQSESLTNNHLMVSLRMDGVFYFTGVKDNKSLFFIRKSYSMPEISGEADFVLIANDVHMKLFINGEEIVSKDDLPIMGDAFGIAILSGTNKDFGTRCMGKDMFVYTW